jgi:signal peptidase II
MQTQSDITRRILALGAGVIAVVFVLDQISKWLVLRELGPDGTRDSVTIIPGFLQLIFVRNFGAAFGIFQGGSGILTVLALLAIGLLLVYFIRSANEDWVLTLALGLMLGGAIGNIVDRFQHGYVVDWIDVPRWPTFNIADSAITVGVALLVYGMLFRDPKRHADDARSPERPVHRQAQEDV